MIGLSTLAAVLTIVFLAALVRGAFGFGDALLGMPLLALFVPLTFATPLMALIGPTIAVLILLREWKAIDLRGTAVLIVSTIAGIPLGLMVLKRADAQLVNIVLAAVIIFFALYNLLRPGLLRLRTDRSAPLFGLVAGVLGAAYNTNGPPVIFYGALRGWPPESFRATLQGYFLPTGTAILIGQGIAGLLTAPVMKTYLYALPCLVLAVAAGRKIGALIPVRRHAGWIYALMLGAGLVLLLKTAL
ncbi:MAG: sulfite exporter TauE/SafE family protein [Acidobacteriota bacterium]|nr:sulfite exporter TauE/SafE family protein [Acidobacteriota bacterium]